MPRWSAWLWQRKSMTFRVALLDAALVFAAVLVTAAVIDERDGWRGGLALGSGFAGVRLLMNLFTVWNGRSEPDGNRRSP